MVPYICKRNVFAYLMFGHTNRSPKSLNLSVCVGPKACVSGSASSGARARGFESRHLHFKLPFSLGELEPPQHVTRDAAYVSRSAAIASASRHQTA